MFIQNMPKEDLVTITRNAPFRLVVTYDPLRYTFYTKFNVEDLSPYPIQSQEVHFGGVRAVGNLSLWYIGFPWTGTETVLDCEYAVSTSCQYFR